MAEMTTPICDTGWTAGDFDLPGIDGRNHRLADVRGAKGTVVMFLCNHCPFVKAVIGRIVRDISELAGHGIGAVAIMPNDIASHPADSFDNMKLFAAQHEFTFPYVLDESQAVARAYDAVCTPDFFGFAAVFAPADAARFTGFFAGPFARLSASSCTARSKSISIGSSPRGTVALVSPSVT